MYEIPKNDTVDEEKKDGYTVSEGGYTEIPKNADLTQEQLKVKKEMILQILEILSYDNYGTVYGGCVRDLINGVVPEDVDIRTYSSNSTLKCARRLIKYLTSLGYQTDIQTIETYFYVDKNLDRLIGNICGKLVDHPDFHEFKDHLKEFSEQYHDCKFDDKIFEKISKIGVDGKFKLDDVLHMRSCERILVTNENVTVNIDLTRHIDTHYIHSLFGIDLSVFDVDVNTLYISDGLRIRSFIDKPVSSIYHNIKNMKYNFIENSYGCSERRLEKMTKKGFVLSTDTPEDTHDSYSFSTDFSTVFISHTLA